MTPWELWGIFLLASLAGALVFLPYGFQNRGQRGARPLILMFVGVSIWILSEFIQLYHGQVQQTPDPTAWGGLAVRLLGIELMVLGVVLLGLEYTGRERWITPKTLAVLAIEPVIVVGLAAFQPEALIQMPPPPSDVMPWGYEVVGTGLWMAHVVYSFMLVFLGLALLADMMLQANYAYRWRIFALMLAIAAPLVVNALFHIGVTPFDLTASSFFFTAVLLMYATFQWRLMDPAPVARRTVIEQMNELVFVLDCDGNISRTNAAVARTFGEREYHGKSITTILGVADLGDPKTGDLEETISVTVGDDHRQFEVTKSVLFDYRGDLLAQVLICRDVTEKRRREEHLELLKDVQSRFLRHNLRNELNTILAHAEFMKSETGPSREESYQTITETSERLVKWGEKARTIERLVEDAERQRHDIGADLNRIVSQLRSRYPDVTVRFDNGESHWVLAVPQVDSAIENLLDNAARYNTASEPWVEITVETTTEQVIVRLSDNGPGIDRTELDAIEAGKETQLTHSSGFGLWLAYWVVDVSDGTIEFEVDDGTRVTLAFDRADRPDTAQLP